MQLLLSHVLVSSMALTPVIIQLFPLVSSYISFAICESLPACRLLWLKENRYFSYWFLLVEYDVVISCSFPGLSSSWCKDVQSIGRDFN